MRSVVVLGMHRSGTSAMSHALGLLGADLGPERHLGKHWENKRLRGVNIRLLEAAGGSWDAPPLEPAWIEAVDAPELDEAAADQVALEYGDADLVAWKDPRTCLTMPFWRPHLGADPFVVLIHRHPYEVARSLESRNRMQFGHAFALWERYNADALRFSAGLPAHVISYSDLLAEPDQVMTQLVKHLRSSDIALPNDPATTDMGLQASERHHVSGQDDLVDHPVATPQQQELFAALVGMDGPHASLTPPELPEPHPLSVEILRAASRLNSLRKRSPSNRRTRRQRKQRGAATTT